MNLIILVIIALCVIDLILFTLNKLSLKLRNRRNVEMMRKNNIKSKLLSKISDLNHKITSFENNHVSKTEYNNLIHKYNILLNQHRLLTTKNKILKSRLKKLKEKLY